MFMFGKKNLMDKFSERQIENYNNDSKLFFYLIDMTKLVIHKYISFIIKYGI